MNAGVGSANQSAKKKPSEVESRSAWQVFPILVALSRHKFDDREDVDGQGNVVVSGVADDGRAKTFLVGMDPTRRFRTSRFHHQTVVGDEIVSMANFDDISRTDEEGRLVCLDAVDVEVAMDDALTSLQAAAGETTATDDVVEASLAE